MPKIGILYGTENTFPAALIERINSKKIRGLRAEFVRIGGVKMNDPSGYRVIVDRASRDIDFYRTYLKNAALNGAFVINNPFWCSADDKFFNYSLASKLGVMVPKTIVLPQKEHPPGTTLQSMRNLAFPLNWDEVFSHVGFPAFLKPFNGGGWKHVFKVSSPEDFFNAYDQTGSMCMTLQSAIQFDDYFRCYVVGQEKVRVMKYNPTLPQHLRYDRSNNGPTPEMHDRLVGDCLTLCGALGYDFNAVEFAVQKGVPYAIDFLNPAPDADVHSVGEANFEWVVENVAQLAIAKACGDERPNEQMRWSGFLQGQAVKAAGSR